MSTQMVQPSPLPCATGLARAIEAMPAIRARERRANILILMVDWFCLKVLEEVGTKMVSLES